MRRLLGGGTKLMVLAGLLALAAGGGLGLLVSLADGQESGRPVFHSGGPVIFNFVPAGTTSEAKSAAISNTGEGVLEITGAEVPLSSRHDFSIVTDGCTGAMLGPGQACTVSLVFHPAAVGTRLGELVITDARGACSNYVTLVGSGTEAPTPTIAKVASCTPTTTVTLPGRTVTVTTKAVTPPGKTVTITAPTIPPDALQLVSQRGCISGRRIRIYLHTTRAERIVSAHTYIGGHRAGAAHGHSIGFVIANLRGKLADHYRVRVVADTATGKSLSAIRSYTTCVASRVK